MPVTAVLITREDRWPLALPNFAFDEILVHARCPDILTRYILAAQAKNDIIYVQDDDCTIDVHALWAHYGGLITNAMTAERQRRYAGTGCTLIGWGCFFPKSMINFARWTDRYGPVDPIEADRIFTYLNQPHHTQVMPIHEHPRHGRMLSNQPGHDQQCNDIIAKLKAL